MNIIEINLDAGDEIEVCASLAVPETTALVVTAEQLRNLQDAADGEACEVTANLKLTQQFPIRRFKVPDNRTWYVVLSARECRSATVRRI